ncbi:uncharacterized protein HKW66_Vig0200580 [Vigna angularis]|uniref:Uncharacterized protein n=1 Tax=Phaseolus angularis TaxID=3914 RepID=A0A8T0JU15_PHAAN|nr:uncharacterized protein HKW66_Vig0200580 [Vigna angularis]
MPQADGGERRTPPLNRTVKKTLVVEESSLDNPDLGPFFLKMARETIASSRRTSHSLVILALLLKTLVTMQVTIHFLIPKLQARRQRVGPRVQVDLYQNMKYISKEPIYLVFTVPIPPSPPPFVDEYSLGQTQFVPSVPSGGTSSSHSSKRKAPMVDVIDAQFDKLTTSLDDFTNVIGSTNVHFSMILNAVVRQVDAMENRNEILRSQTEILRRTPTFTYTEGDIYEMLSGMNIVDENLLEQCYDFLCGNPTCTKRLMGLPPHKTWNKLCKMISGGDC